MDPSLSMSNDPHNPPQFTPFPPFPTSNPFVSGSVGQNHPLYTGHGHGHGPHLIYNPNLVQQNPSPPSTNHPPYSELICGAIAALNEPDGSSKLAISRFIERSNPVLPPAHGALLTHHLKSLKNSGVLSMVKKSYKLSVSSPPESVAVAAAAAAAGLDVPRSEIVPSPIQTVSVSAVSGSASQPQKRGRGRPPKPKPEAQPAPQQQPDVQVNGEPSWVQYSSPKPVETVQSSSVKRGPGRPRKNGASASPIVQATVMAGIMKRRGRPPGRRAAGRQRKPISVSSSSSVFPFAANGVRRRGRPRRVESAGVVGGAIAGGETVAVAPGVKRGRGRPPKIGGVSVMSRLMKPIRGRGRPVGRPRKYGLATVATGTSDAAGYAELKKKFDIFQEKAKEIVNVLKSGVTDGNEAVLQAIQELEGLIAMKAVDDPPPQVMEEEVKPEEEPAVVAAPETEAQNEGEAQGEEQEHEQGQEEGEGENHTQTEAEAMQEALF